MKVHTLDTKALIGTDSILKFKNEASSVNWSEGTNPNPNITSYPLWKYYTTNGTYNRLITDTGPYNNQDLIWETYAGPSQSGNLFGGFNMLAQTDNYQNIPIDVTKNYRFSVWVRTKTSPATLPGNLYFGMWAISGGTRQNIKNVVSGADTNNPYFINTLTGQTSTLLPLSEWRLCVGYIRPYGYTGTTLHSDTGVWKPDGTKIISGYTANDFIMYNTCESVGMRISYMYNSGTDGIGQIVYPRIDVVDGTEPTINELLYSRRPIQLKDNNLLYYGDWADGQSGSINYYIPANLEADSNALYKRQMSTSPYGFSDVVWTNSTTSTNGTTMGGYSLSSTAVSCDTTKTYRYSLWYKLVVKGTEGNVYFGPQAFSPGSLTNLKDVTDSTVSTNKYFTYSTFAQLDSYYPVGEWRLCVGYIRPYGYTGTTNSSETGIWKPDGTNLGLSGAPSHGDQKFENQMTTSLGIKVFAPYSGSVNTVWETYRPRIDIVDGTEPSITELLKG